MGGARGHGGVAGFRPRFIPAQPAWPMKNDGPGADRGAAKSPQ
jgi:hypothetical protein